MPIFSLVTWEGDISKLCYMLVKIILSYDGRPCSFIYSRVSHRLAKKNVAREVLMITYIEELMIHESAVHRNIQLFSAYLHI